MNAFNFIILILAVCLLVVFLFQSIVPFFIKIFLTSKLSEALKAEVTIDDIILNLFVGGLRFEGFAVRGFRDSGVCVDLYIKTAEANFSLLELLAKKIVVRTARFSRIVVTSTYERSESQGIKRPSMVTLALLKPLAYLDKADRKRKLKIDEAKAAKQKELTEEVEGTGRDNQAKFPLVIEKLLIEDMDIRFVEQLVDGSTVETELSDIEATLKNIHYPDSASSNDDVSFMISAVVSATKLGRLRAQGMVKPFSKDVDFSVSLHLDDIYISHFQPYLFPKQNYEVRDGEFGLHSKMVCRSDFLYSKNKVVLSDIVLVPIGKQVNTQDSDLKLLRMTGAVFSNLLNRVTDRKLTIAFDVDANINDPRFRDGSLITMIFMQALQKELVSLIKRTPGGMRGLLGSLLVMPSWSADAGDEITDVEPSKAA